MKSILTLCIWLCLLSISALSQNYLADSPPKSKSAETRIFVKVDTKIDKVVVIDDNEPTNSVTAKIAAGIPDDRRSVLIPIKLKKKGPNSFTVLGYKLGAFVAVIRGGISIELTGEPAKEKTAKTDTGGKSKSGKADSKLKVEKTSIVTDQKTFGFKVTPDKDLKKDLSEYELKVESTENGKPRSYVERFDPTLNEKKDALIATEIPVKLGNNKNKITVKGLKKDGKPIPKAIVEAEIECFKCADEGEKVNNLFTRAIVGTQFAGASSASPAQNAFLDFFFSTPIYKGRQREVFTKKTKMVMVPKRDSDGKQIALLDKNGKPVFAGKKPLFEMEQVTLPVLDEDGKQILEGNRTGNRKFPSFSLWGNVRFSNTAQQNNTDLNLASFSSSFSPLGDKGKLNEVVSSFEVLAGFEWKFFEPAKPSSLFGISQRTIVSAIVMGGFTNPLSPTTNVQDYEIPKIMTTAGMVVRPEFLAFFPNATVDLDNIRIIQTERDRFFKQYYGGLRFRTVYYDKDDNPRNLSPALFDISLGQNESMTDGFKGVVLRLDGFYPFPIEKADYIYLFGTAKLRMAKQEDAQFLPFSLDTPSSGNINSANTLVVQDNELNFFKSNRDVYSLGVGIDLIKLYKRLKPKKP